MKEQALLNLYMDLMRTGESDARAVYMHVLAPDGNTEAKRDAVVLREASSNGEQGQNGGRE